MSLSQSDDELFPTDMFEEPAGFRPPSPTETVHKFTMKNGVELSVSLIGNHSLWAHCLWNAGVFLAKHFDESPYIVKGKRILEFGAAAALPSLLSAKHGAELVVITDYPDQVLVNMLNENAKSNLNFDEIERVACLGFLWGDCTAELMEKSPSGYEIIIMR
jgi:nicotinamide N-methyltransferase